MAFNFIIGQTVNLHQLPDLFWGGHCKVTQNKKKEKTFISDCCNHYNSIAVMIKTIIQANIMHMIIFFGT